MFEETVKNGIVTAANNSTGFSILTNETAYISEKEQMAIEMKFFNEQNFGFWEELHDITSLNEMDAEKLLGQ